MAALLAIGFTAGAQTNVLSPQQTIFQSATDYLTSVDRTEQFTRFLFWDEINYQNQINVSDGLFVSYDIYAPTNCYTGGLSLSAEAGMRNIGVAGQIAGGQGGFGANYNFYSVRIGTYADGGYSPVWHQGYGEIGIRVLKKPTPNTFLGVGLAYDLPQPTSGQNYPLVGIFAGVTF